MDNLLNWINNSELVLPLNNNDIIEIPFKGEPQFETLNMSQMNKNDLWYQLLLNCHENTNNETPQNNFYLEGIIPYLNGEYSCTIRHSVDVITHIDILVDSSDNLDILLNSIITVTIGGFPLIKSSIKLLSGLSTLISNKTIKKKDGKWIIPLYIFELFSKKHLNMMSVQFQAVVITIQCKQQMNIYIRQYGFFLTHEVRKPQESVQLFLPTTSTTYTAENVMYEEIHADRPLFGTFWYQCDYKAFQPEIISFKLIFNGHIEKEIPTQDVKKIRVKGWNGYMIPMNKFKIPDINKMLTNLSDKKYLDMFTNDYFVNYNSINTVHMEVQWSNIHPGSTVIFEIVNLNIYIVSGTMGGPKYSN